jgi:predicted DCC family thiol-disulfide oxidoreductase YuxK
VKHVVFFDGVCNFCNGWIDFLAPRLKPDASVFFASLQGHTAAKLLKSPGMDSIVYLRDGKILIESDAIFGLMSLMRWPWPLFRVLAAVPRGLRNSIYRRVARNRYRWFGKRQECRIPTPEEQRRFQNRFLD